jgi:hypothetical protein
MASTRNLVNLDAMIARSDFAIEDNLEHTHHQITGISLRDLSDEAGVWSLLRKPDFQRETNHWSPEQVVSLLKSFLQGDLIPSVIFWRSPAYLFVIDGGHRLSVLKSWVEDDYGDKIISKNYFGDDIPREQIKAADRIRKLLKQEDIWSYAELTKIKNSGMHLLSPDQRNLVTTAFSRAISIQWVSGNAEKAESSFFNINTKGTPLDEIEENLLKTRHKPISIAARAIIRSGGGHKYWSGFDAMNSEAIVSEAKKIHSLLFNPEINSPIKTLDLPLGGSKGVRTALQILIDFLLVSENKKVLSMKSVETDLDDLNGLSTLSVLKRASKLIGRVTGNGDGSLGLHPAVYFYGPTGRHSSSMFMGTLSLISQKLSENNKEFFKKFSHVRRELEKILVDKKDLIATILQKYISRNRVMKYHEFLESLINSLAAGNKPTEAVLVKMSGLEGKVIAGDFSSNSEKFSDEQKSKIFIHQALKSEIRCSICGGFLDASKSVSYDHILRAREGGKGVAENGQLTHPYCNQSIKN